MRFKRFYYFLSYSIIVILILLPSLISTQDTIGSTYIEIKDLSRIYSAKLEYKYSSNEIQLRDNMENSISINEDGYIGLKNDHQIIYLPSKIYHKDSVLYSPIEIINFIDNGYEENYNIDIDPIFELEWNNPTKYQYVIIDPGHGGKDPGATNGKVYEKDIALKISYKLKYEIERRNSDLIVVLTRTKDTELDKNKSKDLRLRAEIGSKHAKLGTGIYISIHANATPITENKENVKGIETWFYYPNYDLKNKSSYSNEINEYRRLWINNVYNISVSEDTFPPIDLSIGKYSQKLATTMHNSLYNKLNMYTEDRGIKKGVFQVLRESVIPAILCEVGFISNTEEKKLLVNESYQQKIAEGLAEGILQYINSEYPLLSAYK
jgi:N-acetylmuramoyl-L-alanine amidase